MSSKNSFFLLSYLTIAVQTAKAVDHGQSLIDWMRAKGGTVNSKLEIRRANTSDPTSPFGIFAMDDIAKSELLFFVPRNAMLIGDDNCDTTQKLIYEIKKGDASEYAPYAKYLLDQPEGRTPADWSEAGQKLLLAIVGYDDETGDQAIPPEDPLIDWVADSWVDECDGNSSDGLGVNSLRLLMERGWDEILVPISDMINHRNGKWVNAVSLSSPSTSDQKVAASKDIEKGREVLWSYNQCGVECGNRLYEYGTPEILRDYGFVENYPQRFVFHGKRVAFDVDEKDDGSGELEVSWLRKKPNERGVNFLRKELERLNALDIASADKDNMPRGEWFTNKKYYDSLIVALSRAIEAASTPDL